MRPPMSPMARRAAMVLLLLTAGCSSGPQPLPSPTRTTRPTPAAALTFHAYNVRLEPDAEDGTDELRLDFHKTGNAKVVVSGADVDICPVPDLSQSADTSETCTHGTTASFPEDAVAIKATSTAVTLQEVSLTMTPVEHAVKVLLPAVAPASGGCAQDGCNPFFEMTPHRRGTLTVLATWDGIAKGRLSVVEGTPRTKVARRLSSQAVSSDNGAPRIRVQATVTSGDVAVILENEGARPLLSPQISMLWP